jgi:orotate phosphoribosyltransferase
MPVSPLSPELAHIVDECHHVGAIKFGAFVLKLHRTRPDAPLSPHYFDFRTAEHPLVAKRGPVTVQLVYDVGRALKLRLVASQFTATAIAGVPHGAVPYGRFVARRLRLPFIPLKKEERPDGTTSVTGIDGECDYRGHTVVLIEDVVTTAASSIEAIDALEHSDVKVDRVLAILDREQGGGARFAKRGIPFDSLFTYTTIMDHLLSRGDDNILSQAKYDESRAYHLANKVS